MAITTTTSATFEATATGFVTGLVGTIGVRVTDGQGATVTERSTAGITEYPAGSGIYTKTFTAPTAAGQFQIVWDSGGASPTWAVEELTVAYAGATSAYEGDDTARESLLAIIATVRGMVDDPAGDDQWFTDADIARALDRRRDEARYYPLAKKATIAPGGTTTYLTFEAPVGDWEGGVALVDSGYHPATPATSDLIAGRWTFAAEPDLPVMLTGFTHDLYGAAGDLLLARAAAEAAAFDVSADGVTLSRSQKQSGYEQRAYAYLAKARTQVTRLVRTDEWR